MGLVGPDIEVTFEAPDPTVIRLQGPALNSYNRWLEDPSWDNEEALADAIYQQCENHVTMWSTVRNWEYVK